MIDSTNLFLRIAAFYLTLIFIASCSSLNIKYGALNSAGYVDGIYSSKTPIELKIDTLSYSQFRWKLRNNFQFRYDYAQYAISQPRSFDWNNRLLGFRFNRYNYWNPFVYNNYAWNRTQMWNDWAWDYPWFSNNRWSTFYFDQWGYFHMNNGPWYQPYYYGYNNWNYRPNYNRRPNIAYINGRRGSSNVTENRTNIRVRTPRSSTVGNTLINEPRVKVNKRRTINIDDDDQTIRTNTRIYVRPESSNNGGRSRSREILPPKPIVPRQPSTVQPRQIRRGSGSPVLQQTRTRVQSSSQGRSSSGRRQN